MRSIRILLQAIIVLFGSTFVAALILAPFPQYSSVAGVTVFFVFLFVLTLLLKEYTDSRLIASRKVNPKMPGLFSGFVSAGMCWLSWSIVNGYQGSTIRRWSILRSAIEFIGPWPPALFFLVSGIFFSWVAWHVFRSK
jgi:uncharacterized membrane protein